MKAKQLIISAALAASLVFGVGAALAQDESTPNPPTEQRGFRGPRGDRGFGLMRPFHQQERMRDRLHPLQLVEEYTGLTLAELREAHQNGQSLAELIAANGQSVDDFIAAATANLNARIDTAVANGRITAAQAEQLKALALERITARVNGAFGGMHQGMGGMLADL